MSHCNDEFVFTWTIENYYLCDKNREELLCSPVFSASNFNGSKWRIGFYPRGSLHSVDFVSLILFRCWDDNFPEKLTINFRIELCNSENESFIFAEKKGMEFASGSEYLVKNFILVEELEKEMKDSAKDHLVVRCQMSLQESDRTEIPSKFVCSAITEIGFNTSTFTWDTAVNCLSNFSNLSKTKTFTTDDGVQFCVNLAGQRDELLFKITHSNKCFTPFLGVKCEIILLCDYGEIELFKQRDCFTFGKKHSTWHFPSIHKKSWFKKYNLKHGYLLLKFNFSTSNGKVFSKLTGNSKIPNKCFVSKEISISKSLVIDMDPVFENFGTKSVQLGKLSDSITGSSLLSSSTVDNNPSPTSCLPEDLHTMLLNGELTDVNFRIGSEIVSAHKFVLVSRSPVFSTMFKLNIVHNETGVIDITDTDVETWRLFLEFFYTGEIRCLDWKKALDLMVVADKYKVLSLKQKLTQFLKARLSRYNVSNVISVADKVGDKELKKVAIDYMVENAEKILSSSE